MPELESNVNYKGALNQIEDCVHSVFNKGVEYGRYLERQAMKERERHGKWLHKTRKYEMDEWNCSECGQLLTTAVGQRMDYCPKCGAKMEVLTVRDCNKCIHEDVCDQSSRQMWSRMNGETNCADFKDREKYAEVRHGKWDKNHKKKWYCDDELNGWYATPEICTYCGYDATEFGKGIGIYCPNCGAKMDLGKD